MSRKARARLALRAESAFGLKSLPIALPELSAVAPSLASPPKPIPPAPPPRVVTPPRAIPPARVVTPPRTIAPPEPPPKSPRGGTQVTTPPTLLIFDEPITGPALSRQQKIDALTALDTNEVKGCTKCRLCESRTHTVFGEGDPDAQLFFIGEGPGQNEDEQARPFVGRSGDKLNDFIAAMGLSREQVFIANVVKCRPPENRNPAPDEVAICTPYLTRQLEIVRPKVIVTLGLPAVQFMLATKKSMGSLRGQWQSWRGIKLMPTFHPAYVLRSYTPEVRGKVWSDLQQVMTELNMSLPKKKSGQ